MLPWQSSNHFWIAAKELKVSYHNPEILLFTVYPNYRVWVAVKELNLSYHNMDIEQIMRFLNYGS